MISFLLLLQLSFPHFMFDCVFFKLRQHDACLCGGFFLDFSSSTFFHSKCNILFLVINVMRYCGKCVRSHGQLTPHGCICIITKNSVQSLFVGTSEVASIGTGQSRRDEFRTWIDDRFNGDEIFMTFGKAIRHRTKPTRSFTNVTVCCKVWRRLKQSISDQDHMFRSTT